jgi:hypothetical protein
MALSLLSRGCVRKLLRSSDLHRVAHFRHLMKCDELMMHASSGPAPIHSSTLLDGHGWAGPATATCVLRCVRAALLDGTKL